MLPSEIASIANTVRGFTATVSLIYVGIQIRLSVRHTRASIPQGTEYYPSEGRIICLGIQRSAKEPIGR